MKKKLYKKMAVLLAAGAALWYVNVSLRPVLEGLAAARVESAAARAMNEAILEVLGTASFVLEGKTLATVNMLAEKSVEVNTLLSAKNHLFSFLFEGPMGNIIKWVLIIIIAWAALALLFWVIRQIFRLVVWGNGKKDKPEKEDKTEKPENMNKM